MELTDRDIKRFVVLLMVAVLAILTFMVVRPVITAILAGLILAYMFFPVYKRVTRIVKYPSISAAIVSFLVLVLILLPVWFLTPIIIQQVFQIFQFLQQLDVSALLSRLFPNMTEQLRSQITVTIASALSNATSSLLNALVNYVVNFAAIALQVLLIAFVFFFALRDESKFKEFVSGLSPLKKTQEEKVVKQFKDVTDSIINGQIVAGLLQGVLAGIGFLVFGVPNALILTVVSVVLGIIPLVGPGLVYLPITIYLYLYSSPVAALIYLVYNMAIVSSIDNLIRAHLVSRKTQLSQVVVLVGMIGGLLIFGILGLILGPLIIAYFITLLKAYKDKTLSSFFEY